MSEDFPLQTINKEALDTLIAEGVFPPIYFSDNYDGHISYYWLINEKWLYCFNLAPDGKAYITWTKTDYASPLMSFKKAVEHAQTIL